MAKILVTGGAGFIGSTLVDKLLEEGHEVVVVDNLSSGRQEYLDPRVRFYKEDIRSAALAEILEKERPEVVYHLAAQIDVRVSVADPRLDNDINLLGGINLLENCRLYGVKKIIFASTGGAIYGETDLVPTPESAPAYPLSPYGIHKLALEKFLNFYYQVYGLDYTILRFANVYGPRQFKGGEAGVVAIFIDNAVKEQPSRQFGDGRQTRDFVYVGDVAAALSRAKEVEYHGEINIGSGRETSLLELRAGIEKALGREIAVSVEPGKAGEQRRSCLSRQRALEVLGWEPQISLEEGVKRTIRWSQENIAK